MRFCAVTKYFDKRVHLRRIDEVLKEIELQERKLVFFVDDNIAANHQALKELCRALIPMRIRWVSQASLDITRDRELMDVMLESGCLGHVMGFESLQPESLNRHAKAPTCRAFLVMQMS